MTIAIVGIVLAVGGFFVYTLLPRKTNAERTFEDNEQYEYVKNQAKSKKAGA